MQQGSTILRNFFLFLDSLFFLKIKKFLAIKKSLTSLQKQKLNTVIAFMYMFVVVNLIFKHVRPDKSIIHETNKKRKKYRIEEIIFKVT